MSFPNLHGARCQHISLAAIFSCRQGGGWRLQMSLLMLLGVAAESCWSSSFRTQRPTLIDSNKAQSLAHAHWIFCRKICSKKTHCFDSVILHFSKCLFALNMCRFGKSIAAIHIKYLLTRSNNMMALWNRVIVSMWLFPCKNLTVWQNNWKMIT